jgi:hypothetical protein
MPRSVHIGFTWGFEAWLIAVVVVLGIVLATGFYLGWRAARRVRHEP